MSARKKGRGDLRRFRYDYSIFDIPKTAKILDVGCGFGDRIEILKDMNCLDVSGIDIDEYMIQEAQKKGFKVSFGAIEDTKLNENNLMLFLLKMYSIILACMNKLWMNYTES